MAAEIRVTPAGDGGATILVRQQSGPLTGAWAEVPLTRDELNNLRLALERVLEPAERVS